MRRRIDLPGLYGDAAEQLENTSYDGVAPLAWPSDCPFSLDELLQGKRAELEKQLTAPGL